jgi:SagB-type dehydrogenase family enzyme
MPLPTLPAAEYHRLTSYDRHRMTPHRLDWANQPRLDKAYPPLDKLPLDHAPTLPTVNFMELVQRAGSSADHPASPLDLHTISSLFRLTHAVTARSMHGDQPFYYRSVASAGALYPFELYLAAHHLDGVAPGVYHYDLFNFSLDILRSSPVPVIPTADHGVAATIYIGGIFFRSAWKYRHRAFRYVLLDAGHLMENLRLALSALGLAFSVELEFDDLKAGILLGLDPKREVCLACIHITDGGKDTDKRLPAVDLALLPSEIGQASRVSMRETVYPDIEQAHRAGYGQIKPIHDHRCAVDGIGRSPDTWQALTPAPPPPTPDYVEVLWQRRSRRNFISSPLGEGQLAGFLDLIATAAQGPASRPSLLTIGILAGEGTAISPGFYLFDTRHRRLGQLATGPLMASMAAACLDQMWLKNAAFHLLFITDPAALDSIWGARAYRHAMLEAGRLGQQAYLAATALGLGACGIGAIYDREAADLLNLTDDGALLYLLGIGPIKGR